VKPRAGSDDPVFIAFGKGTGMKQYDTVFAGTVKQLEAILRYWEFDVPRKR